MRLDVDSMTYEVWNGMLAHLGCGLHLVDRFICFLLLQELVALEEQIGNVNSGFTESYIEENLKSSSYVPDADCMPDQSSVEKDACIICQVFLLVINLL